MDIKDAYQSLAEKVIEGKKLLEELDSEKGLTGKHLAWGGYCETLIASIDPNGESYDKSSPVGMFHEGWNLATFAWPGLDDGTRNKRTTEGFAIAVGTLDAIVAREPTPRKPPSPAPQTSRESAPVTSSRPYHPPILSGRTTEQVIVKFRNDDATRAALRNLTSQDPDARRLYSDAGILEQVLTSPNVQAIEPLFAGRQEHEVRGERGLMSLETNNGDELAGLNVLTFDTDEKAKFAVEQLERDRHVQYAHLIPPRFLFAKKVTGKAKVVAAGSKPNSLTNRQWGLIAIELMQAQQDPKFPNALKVKIAVIDSGVDDGHPDLAGVVAPPMNFTTGPNVDSVGHGTHVIGIIAALCNTNVGITGVCQSSGLLSLKALDPYDGPGYYRAIRHATVQKVQVINLSLGGNRDLTEELLVRRAVASGIVVVAAMGNDYQPVKQLDSSRRTSPTRPLEHPS